MKIALVDDERPELDRLSEMISRQLCMFGDMTYKIDAYTSGEEFLDHWQAGRYDLVVLDIFMDKLLGVDVAHIIRETDRDVRLVFCTTSKRIRQRELRGRRPLLSA